jgi:hypothetical protein
LGKAMLGEVRRGAEEGTRGPRRGGEQGWRPAGGEHR